MQTENHNYRLQIRQGSSFEELGPLNMEELQVLAQKGILNSESLYFHEQSNTWQPISSNLSLNQSLFSKSSPLYELLIDNSEKPTLKTPQKLTFETIQDLFKAGKIKPETLILNKHSKNWTPLNQYPEVFNKLNSFNQAPTSFFNPIKKEITPVQKILPKQSEEKLDKTPLPKPAPLPNTPPSKYSKNILILSNSILFCLILYFEHIQDIHTVIKSYDNHFSFLKAVLVNPAFGLIFFNILVNLYVLINIKRSEFNALKVLLFINLGYLSYLYLHFGHNFSLGLVLSSSICFYSGIKVENKLKNIFLLSLSLVMNIMLCLSLFNF